MRVTGVGADEVPLTAEHLVRAGRHRHGFAAVGEPVARAATVKCVNCIPHGGGLGSSAAAIVAGLLLGRELIVAGGGRRLSDDEVLALAAPDRGSSRQRCPRLVRRLHHWPSRPTREAGRAVRREVHPEVRVVVFSAPPGRLHHHTRGLLPATVPHADAAANVAAAGAAGPRADRRDPHCLLPATEDRLHQDYRAPAMPATADLVADLRAAGIAAVISGAGPSVIALVTAEIDLAAGGLRPGFEAAEVDRVPRTARRFTRPDQPTRLWAVA